MLPIHVQLQNSTLRGVLRRLHVPLEIMLVCVRWYAAYALSTRNLEEMMAERRVLVDHTTMHRWAVKMLPALLVAEACGPLVVSCGSQQTKRKESRSKI